MSKTAFYDSSAWRRVRLEVLRKHNNECQICKERHIHTRAVIVHHVYHLEEYPDWGLLEFVRDPVTEKETKNLLPVCRDCHETVCHPERIREWTAPPEPLTRERW